LKLLRFGNPGTERPGVIDGTGTIRDVSTLIADYSPETLGDPLIRTLAETDLSSLPAVPAETRIGAPLSRIGHFIAIGLNYADHAAESGMAIPTEPIVFSKAPSSLSGPNDPVVLPRGSVKGDWEVELAIVIGTGGDYIAKEDALSHVLGYAVCNDVSEREYQAERGGQWIKGKSAPSFGPLGPWIVTRDEVPDPQALDLFLDLNGTRAQTGNTSTMIFSVVEIIAYVSQFMRLEPGDVITTGTPPGVGMGMKPQRFLKVGDEMLLGVAGLGEQRQRVIARD
jgi:2-keto-4-pentenoate hydratase/2-oxohepta-3-ene-1,7-dioic acid hydratase in catechol pathway